MEGQNHSVKERLEQLETFMGKYTAGGKDLCVAFSGGVDSSLILKAAVKAATKDGSKVFAVTFDSRLHPPATWRLPGAWQGSWEESMRLLPWMSWSRSQ